MTTWQNTGWYPESTPIYDAVVAGSCVHGRVRSLGCYKCYPCCNYDEHPHCHFCGEYLRHDGSPVDLEPASFNPCYLPDEPPRGPGPVYPIFASVARDMPEGAREFFTLQVRLRQIAAEINAMNRQVQERFRRAAEIRLAHGAKPGQSLLEGITKT